MGPSGSGKSTLMHILAGLDRPTSGDVFIDGTAIGELNDTQLTKLRRKHIGFIFQFFNLLPMLTAKENIVLPLSIAGTKPDDGWVDELAAKVGLTDRLSHRPAEMSGGQQQRVAIARALVSSPTVMFADEPTGNLDSKTSSEILALLRESVSSLGQTTVMVTHDARAAAIADRILFLADGEIVTDLGPSTPSRDPRDARGGERKMIRVALKGLLGRKLRAILTAFAIVLGVAMISGSFVLTDTLGASLDGVYQESYKGTDAVDQLEAQGAAGRRHDREGSASPAGVLADIEHVLRRRAPRRARSRITSASSTRPASGSASRTTGSPSPSAIPTTPRSARVKVVAGTWPRHGDEIAIDKATATKQHFAVGQTVGAFGDGPVQRYRISGLITFGSADSLAGSTLTVFDLPTAQRLFHKQGKFDLIRVGADKGVSEATLVEQLTPKVAADARRQHRRGAGRLGQQADPGRAEHLQVHPARLRRHRALRRQLRDREHPRDHGRPADA